MSIRIKRFVLDDPASRNAFSLKQAENLGREISSKNFSYDALLFNAKGPLFSSGGNLADYAQMKTASQGKAANRKIAKILDTLAALPIPTACVVQGDCLGGGLELVAAFDFVIAVPEANFCFWQRRIALSFGWGGRGRLEKRLSRALIDQLAISSRNLSSYEALSIGLIDEISISAIATQNAEKWLTKTASLPALPLQEIKKSRSKKIDERNLFEKLWWNKEHLAVLRKFKR